ncbi:hypothetical protein [Roseimicrobium sp. ORNL1]|uniref:hypothetical protein n=1 Tax=Roseimicrobium sp. ORNL1 TaxID=2711231 RepID=UPI0013E1ACD9|nr:hypothetical protein [Roseimicrobium sp. ORNL1]QIF01153.1 hypothetical protein G5S37_06345 [Roseimicrobium sp. ORNL1]
MKIILCCLVALTLASCANVQVTKTSKGTYASTNPNLVEILKTRPERSYEELGAVDALGFGPSEVAKMHNGLRAKAATLGANAVIITDEGLINDGWAITRFASGVAIRFK